MRGDQHQHPVRVAVDQPGDRRVPVFRKRILHHRCERCQLLVGRDDLFADGIVGVVGVDQRDKVRGYIHAKQVRGSECFALGVGQRENLFDFLPGVQPVAQLPAPVVPLFVGHIRESRSAFRWERKVVHGTSKRIVSPLYTFLGVRIRVGLLAPSAFYSHLFSQSCVILAVDPFCEMRHHFSSSSAVLCYTSPPV